MAIIKPKWTENVTLHGSSSVSAAASATDDVDLANLGADAISAQIEIIFGGTPDGPVLIEIFASPDSGVNDDTEPLFAFELPEATSATKRITFNLQNVAYVAVKITNNDTTDAVTYEALYAWRQWETA